MSKRGVDALRGAADEPADMTKRTSEPSYGGDRVSVTQVHGRYARGQHSRREKALIAIAVSIVKGCERRVVYHVRSAGAKGATGGSRPDWPL